MIQTSNSGLIGRTKVLIVDHEYHARKTIRALLLAMGCTRIHEAGDGGTGLDAVRAIAPDVVLLDWDMPGIDGAEFVRRLRSDGGCAHANVPIIMLTGHREHSRVLQAVRHGVHEFLLKPVSRAALKARMLSALASSAGMAKSGHAALVASRASSQAVRLVAPNRGIKRQCAGDPLGGSAWRRLRCRRATARRRACLISFSPLIRGRPRPGPSCSTTDLLPVAAAQQEFPQLYPAPGLVEHDPEAIWSTTLATMRAAVERAGIRAQEIAALGITNQRETTVIWDRATGMPIHNAIVWQDRRTADICAALRRQGHEPMISARTGLLLDPYFSATKIAWILDHVEGARAAASAGRLAFGTVDSFLLWRLTGGKVHATDATNAARTLLMDIRARQLGRRALRIVRGAACAASRGARLCRRVRQHGCAGRADPHSRHGRRPAGGDGRAGLLCAGHDEIDLRHRLLCAAQYRDEPVRSSNRLLTTIAYQLGGRRTYALEGAIFVAGAAVQWLRDALKMIAAAPDVNALAAAADPAEQVYLVPAFVGLGAPWWDAHARGAIYGLTRKSGVPELARAALEAVGYQTRDLLEAMRADWPAAATDTVLRVDGGMAASDVTMQFLADISGSAGRSAGGDGDNRAGRGLSRRLCRGLCPDLPGFAATWKRERRFHPGMDAATRERKWSGWRDAVARTLSERRKRALAWPAWRGEPPTIESALRREDDLVAKAARGAAVGALRGREQAFLRRCRGGKPDA